MRDEQRSTAVVPDVTGLPFHVGRDLAHDAGVTLANPDPDGPPIGALCWPGLFFITWQSPAPGTVAATWSSVAIGVSADGDAPSPALRPDASPPPALRESASPDRPAVPRR